MAELKESLKYLGYSKSKEVMGRLEGGYVGLVRGSHMHIHGTLKPLPLHQEGKSPFPQYWKKMGKKPVA